MQIFCLQISHDAKVSSCIMKVQNLQEKMKERSEVHDLKLCPSCVCVCCCSGPTGEVKTVLQMREMRFVDTCCNGPVW